MLLQNSVCIGILFFINISISYIIFIQEILNQE